MRVKCAIDQTREERRESLLVDLVVTAICIITSLIAFAVTIDNLM